MSLPPRQHAEQQRAFLRQADLLRTNLAAWEATLRSARGEGWPAMLGRLNAAFNQAGNLDRHIEDASEHFVYVPRKCTVNPQDMAFFLSTRLAAAAGGEEHEDADEKKEGLEGIGEEAGEGSQFYGGEAPATRLRRYEGRVAELASEFEEGMVRF